MIEQAVLTHVRTVLGLPAHVAKRYMPHNGHTETFAEARIDRGALWCLVNNEAARLGYGDTEPATEMH